MFFCVEPRTQFTFKKLGGFMQHRWSSWIFSLRGPCEKTNDSMQILIEALTKSGDIDPDAYTSTNKN